MDKKSAWVKCPYYSECDGNNIFCEGVEDGSRIRLSFSKRNRYKAYADEYCCSDKNWKKCRIADMNEKKWDEYFKNERR